MPHSEEMVEILMADDDPDDRLLASKALHEYRLKNGIRFVEDGESDDDLLGVPLPPWPDRSDRFAVDPADGGVRTRINRAERGLPRAYLRNW